MRLLLSIKTFNLRKGVISLLLSIVLSVLSLLGYYVIGFSAQAAQGVEVWYLIDLLKIMSVIFIVFGFLAMLWGTFNHYQYKEKDLL